MNTEEYSWDISYTENESMEEFLENLSDGIIPCTGLDLEKMKEGIDFYFKNKYGEDFLEKDKQSKQQNLIDLI